MAAIYGERYGAKYGAKKKGAKREERRTKGRVPTSDKPPFYDGNRNGHPPTPGARGSAGDAIASIAGDPVCVALRRTVSALRRRGGSKGGEIGGLVGGGNGGKGGKGERGES